MRILLSEAAPDYANYVFPYAIWGFLEEGEHPADAFAAGFLPSLPDLSRFYLCRQIRVVLPRFSPNSENRRILRHGEGLGFQLIPRKDFEWTPERRAFCLGCATTRWSRAPRPERIDRIFSAPLTTHVALFTEAKGRDAGIVSLYRDGGTWFYSNAFYATDAPSGRGAFLMTKTIQELASEGASFLHLGTCYSRSALYKTQFPGVEFFDGTAWRKDLHQLKELLARPDSDAQGHLLEDGAYRKRWVPEGLEALAATSPLVLHISRAS